MYSSYDITDKMSCFACNITSYMSCVISTYKHLLPCMPITNILLLNRSAYPVMFVRLCHLFRNTHLLFNQWTYCTTCYTSALLCFDELHHVLSHYQLTKSLSSFCVLALIYLSWTSSVLYDIFSVLFKSNICLSCIKSDLYYIYVIGCAFP